MLHKIDARHGQSSRAFIREGFHTLSAEQASAVLRECQFEGQRPVVTNQISVLADLMRRGRWRPKDQIDFALHDDRLILINGYHRCNAQTITGKAIEWSIVIHRCAAMDEVRSLYYTFDTNNQARGSRQILNGVGFAEGSGLEKDFRHALFAAAPVIASGFRTGKNAKDPLVTRVMDRRLDLASQYLDTALLFQKALSSAPKLVKKKMLSAGCCAVALVTLRYQPVKAMEFWSGASANDGLRRGDPRQTLVTDLLTRQMNSGGQHQSMAAPTLAWNAFYQDRQLKIIKVYDAEVMKIAGTPFDGKA